MSFYENLAKYYGELFKPGEEKINQLENFFMNLPGKKLLDLGCGSGEHLAALEKRGFEVFGLDNSPEMVEKARRLVMEKKQTSIRVGDISEPYPFEVEVTFDGIFCIGNTLPHLDNLKQVKNALIEAYNRLNSQGLILIQNINYDNPHIEQKEFPILEAEEGRVKFHRQYICPKEGFGDKIIFKITLEVNSDIYEDSYKLLILKRNDLEKCLKEVGFKKLEFYSDLNKKTWTKDGANTVVVAIKG